MRFKVRLLFLFLGISFFIFLMYDLRKGMKQMELVEEDNIAAGNKEMLEADIDDQPNQDNLDFIDHKDKEETNADAKVDMKPEEVKEEPQADEAAKDAEPEPAKEEEPEDDYLEIYQDGKKLDEKFAKEIREMKRYRGGPLEPEWKWVEDISIVYTWVNGSDLNHLDLKSKYNGGNRNIDNRDRSVDELRYSLRSLEKYLPWHKGTIYIVSPNQTPVWLNTNSRVKVINQDDLLPPNVAPTFNTFTIELFLDKIPGITERFIQLNDDYFFKTYTHPSFFFTSKTFYPKFYQTNKSIGGGRGRALEISKMDNAGMIKKFQGAVYNTNQAIREAFGDKNKLKWLDHSPYNWYRDLFEPARQLFKSQVQDTISHKFRHPLDLIPPYALEFYTYYATRNVHYPEEVGGNGVARFTAPVKLSDQSTITDFSCEIVPQEVRKEVIRFGSVYNNITRNDRFFNEIANSNILMFNLNDDYKSKEAGLQLLNFMRRQYPVMSSFELFDAVVEDDTKTPQEPEKKEKDKKEEEVDDTSPREQEEIDFLLNYQGEPLEPEWKWAEEMSFVYSWVNGSDPRHLDLKAQYNGGEKKADNRDRSMDELRYSLRSFEKYLPWHRGKIYIVTPNQVPLWLDTANSRIEVINQEDIIPAEANPTFNSFLMEMYLDKIPGISERFVYLNDDYFFRTYTHPRFFFADKTFAPKFYLGKKVPFGMKKALEMNENKNSLSMIKKFQSAVFYTNGIVKEAFGNSINIRWLDHSPYSWYRDLFEPARQLFRKYVDQSLTHRFRDALDLIPTYGFQAYVMYGAAVPNYPDYVGGDGTAKNSAPVELNKDRTIQTYTFDIVSPNVRSKTIKFGSVYENLEKNEKLYNEIRNSTVLLYNLNDDYKSEKAGQNLVSFMTSMYPFPSKFELSEEDIQQRLEQGFDGTVTSLASHASSPADDLHPGEGEAEGEGEANDNDNDNEDLNLLGGDEMDLMKEEEKENEGNDNDNDNDNDHGENEPVDYKGEDKEINDIVNAEEAQIQQEEEEEEEGGKAEGDLEVADPLEASSQQKPKYITDDPELDLLLNYDGGELEPEWEWAKDMSIVYTWINGSDYNHLDLKAKYNGGNRKVNSRDRSVGELRYSLRSLEKYLPWHRGMIFIVTPHQTPDFLNLDHPRIKVINQDDLFPPHVAPTFNSFVVELYLDKIPGLSERFIQLNDDYFFNNYCHPSFFFTAQGFYPKFYRTNRKVLGLRKTSEGIVKMKKANMIHKFHGSIYNTNEAVKSAFGRSAVIYWLDHSPYCWYRDLYEPARQVYARQVNETLLHKFRHPLDIVPTYAFQAFTEYAPKNDQFPEKVGGSGEAQHLAPFTLPSDRTITDYSFEVVPQSVRRKVIKFGSIVNNVSKNEKLFAKIVGSTYIMYNLNDDYYKKEARDQLIEFMRTQYPHPSSFERTDVHDPESSLESSQPKDSEEAKATSDPSTPDLTQWSDREVRELQTILGYRGEPLDDTWRWAENLDIVYIWSNATDPDYHAAWKKYAKSKADPPAAKRYDELKYSLRSVERYLPWHKGKIYVVTPGQTPDWFDPEASDRIQLVHQDDLLPSEAIPTFNIFVLEMYLDRIPNLSERFLYFNNNHYFKTYTHPAFFFNEAKAPKYYLRRKVTNDKAKALEIAKGKKLKDFRKYQGSLYYTNGIVKEAFGHGASIRYTERAPYAWYRDLFAPARQFYETYVKDTTKHRVMNVLDIIPTYAIQSFNIFGAANPFFPTKLSGDGKAPEAPAFTLPADRTIDYYAFDIASPNIIDWTFKTVTVPQKMTKFKEDLMAIQDSKAVFYSVKLQGNEDRYLDTLTAFMNEQYSEPSRFEKSSTPE